MHITFVAVAGASGYAGGELLRYVAQHPHFDWWLAPYDLRQTRADAHVLHRAGLLTGAEAAAIEQAIDELSTEVAAGTVAPIPGDEDVYTAIERLLVEKLGDLGGKLRAGRSRNDQVATDF